jgi:hypothetical protein
VERAQATPTADVHRGGGRQPHQIDDGVQPCQVVDARVQVHLIPPDAQQYRPHAIAGIPDVTALRRLRKARVPPLLYAPPPHRGGPRRRGRRVPLLDPCVLR